MARIRTIKPEFNSSASVARMSDAAQLFMLKLLTEMDDYGRMRWLPKKVAGVLYPYSETVGAQEVEAYAQELVKEQILLIYVVDGERYACFPNWSDHQRIDKPSKSSIPARFELKTDDSQDTRETLAQVSRDSSDTLAEKCSLEREQGTGKGNRDMEGECEGHGGNPNPSEKKQDAPAIAVAKPEGKFKEPELSVIQAYGQTIGVSAAECEGFRDHHKARGWVPSGSRTQMKDWQAALRTWKRNTTKFGSKPKPGPGVDEFGGFEVIR